DVRRHTTLTSIAAAVVLPTLLERLTRNHPLPDVHKLGELRQPRDHRRAYVLGHVRRDRARVCARLRRGAALEREAAGRHVARAAGTAPGEHVPPEVVEVMRELGIDLADRRPQLLARELAEQADLVVTMGCGDEYPYIPGKRYLDWELPDPKGRPLAEVRATRDEIAHRVRALTDELDRTPARRGTRRKPNSPPLPGQAVIAARLR